MNPTKLLNDWANATTFHTSEPQSCQHSNPLRAFTFYLIANMSNSQFTEAGRKKKATRVCNLQSKSTQQKDSSSEDGGIQSCFKRQERETHPALFILSSCVVCKPSESSLRPRLITLLQRAHFLGLVVLLSPRREHSRQGKRLWQKSFLGEGCVKTQPIPLGLLIRIPGAQGSVSLRNPWNNQMSRTISKRERARSHLNAIIFT